MSMCNCNQGRLPCTCKTAPGRTHHPLANIAEWRKGCSCAPKEYPVQCEACTEGLILAVENWFTQRNTRRGAVADNILENLDDRAGAKGKGIAGDAATLIRELDAELYAAQDQVAGMQELMAAQRAPESLDGAVRYLVAQADAKAGTMHYAAGGSPRHGHNVPGRWDGDATHAKGALCEECAAWDIMRKYVATDIEATARVLAPVPQPMDSAPTDGTRVLIHTEVHHYSADRYQICAWRVIGTQWLEARFKDGKWVEWCGNDKTNSTNTLHPIEWALLPAGAAPCLSN